ncbi:MAG: ATP-binding protein [Candidatus Latescibacterota bacterium]
MEKSFKRDVFALHEVVGFLHDFARVFAISDRASFFARLVLEELFTNLVKHNEGGRERISISLEREGNKMVFRMTDFDVEPFDMDTIAPVDIQDTIDQSKSGKLGLHLVQRIVDEITYKYSDVDRTLRVTAVKNLEADDVRNHVG